MKHKIKQYREISLKKFFTGILILCMILFNTLPIHAATIQTPPSAPTAPSAPAAPSVPSTSQTPSPQQQTSTSNTNNTTNNPPHEHTPTTSTPTQSPSVNSGGNPQQNDPHWDPTVSTSPTPTSAPAGTNAVTTGNANPQNTSTTTGNNNGATSPSGIGTTHDASPTPSSSNATNAGNGAQSTNATSTSTNNTTSAVQTNTASSAQTLSQASVTGKNNASENVGDTATKTGDANVSGTIITAQNTNVDGVAVAEFNIADNHTGDLVLDFGAHCISGCSTTVPGEIVKNIGNGAGSTNTSQANKTSQSSLTQTNDGSVGNNLVLTANSGDNLSNKNTGGNTGIQTGNANVSANSLTFLNNNIASGNVVYGVVNIYGNLQGDIILPQSVLDSFNPCTNGCNNTNTSLSNAGNGAGSSNTSVANQMSHNLLSQTNDAVIDNNLQTTSTTGGNDATRNTGGTTTVNSGQASADSHVLNIANSNISDGNLWLVLVNKAGQWIGQLIGAPSGSTVASNGLTITSDANGNVSASNNGNGAGSTNNAQTTQNSQTTTQQKNTGTVGNKLTLSANTGGNIANENTGGNVTVQTGDAKILANIVNFVNDNIVGKGKLFVTVVNVFGKWVGDFVTPGQTKQHTQTPQNNTNTQTNAQQTTTQSIATPTQSPSPSSAPQQPAQLATTPTASNNQNPITENTNGPTAQGGSGTVRTTFDTAQKTTVAAIHVAPVKKTITINLAWILLALPPLSVSLLLFKLLKRK